MQGRWGGGTPARGERTAPDLPAGTRDGHGMGVGGIAAAAAPPLSTSRHCIRPLAVSLAQSVGRSVGRSVRVELTSNSSIMRSTLTCPGSPKYVITLISCSGFSATRRPAGGGGSSSISVIVRTGIARLAGRPAARRPCWRFPTKHTRLRAHCAGSGPPHIHPHWAHRRGSRRGGCTPSRAA